MDPEPRGPQPARRRLTLVDAMILVALTAMGFAWVRTLDAHVLDLRALSAEAAEAESLRARVDVYLGQARDLVPFAATWSIGFALLRLRRPRPSLRRIARQPGFAASCAAVVTFGVEALEYTAYALNSYGPRGFFLAMTSREHWAYVFEYWLEPEGLMKSVATAVCSVWIVLALGRALRPERSWVDRGGRALGCFWLVLYAIRLWLLQAA